MKKTSYKWEDLGVLARLSFFDVPDGAGEFHAVLQVEARRELFAAQLERIYSAEERILHELPNGTKAVMKRYFLSDATNQTPLMRKETDCAVSYIQQQPLDGSKIAVWIYFVNGMDVRTLDDGTVEARHDNIRHLWKMGLCCNDGDSFTQTRNVLENYEQSLENQGLTIEKNCLRTWFFVRDVDTQYAGMVQARRENFDTRGLTSSTHYIASTGIQGLPADPKAIIQLGAYAVDGVKPEQIQYLHAASHLNPTYEYGVTFERGTAVDYDDRRHVIISGTASIDNRGKVLHVGDIDKQTRRMWENVEKLLEEGGATFDDVAQIVVYLRDVADFQRVNELFNAKFPDTPYVVTYAPVCRPEWLVEMECWAIVKK